jgi:hypothetical protein
MGSHTGTVIDALALGPVTGACLVGWVRWGNALPEKELPYLMVVHKVPKGIVREPVIWNLL